MAGFARETMALAILLLAILACSAELQRFESPVKPDGSLSILVVGDWGRKGQFNQSQVATQVLSLFCDSLPKKRGDVLAQLSPVLRNIDSRWLCLRNFILNAGEIKTTTVC
ncbi:hypothetical protein BHE74_00049711 [Ensete ventricosum]|nr:hypothetical protein BHE74_00049711 [Ensete ventricosum]